MNLIENADWTFDVQVQSLRQQLEELARERSITIVNTSGTGIYSLLHITGAFYSFFMNLRDANFFSMQTLITGLI
jgi:hypothetical protein